MKLATSISILLLLVAAIVEWGVDQKSAYQIIAEEHIGTCEATEFLGAKAFQSSNKTAIFFKCTGFQGSIEGLFVISNNEIEKLMILKSNESLDKSALNYYNFLKSFEQNIEDLPIDVDAVSGATISSQIIIDEMNQIIKEWNKNNE